MEKPQMPPLMAMENPLSIEDLHPTILHSHGDQSQNRL